MVKLSRSLLLLSALLVISGCSCQTSNAAEKPVPRCGAQVSRQPPLKEFVYLDKKVYVYQKDYLFNLLQPQMKRKFEEMMSPVVAYARQNPHLSIHIDSYGDDALNSTFATKQSVFEAEAVAAYLWAERVENHVNYAGHGKGKHPVSSNRDATVGRENRRVEIEFIDESQKS